MVDDFSRITPPEGGIIEFRAMEKPVVPDDPVIPFIEGDGIGPDIWRAAKFVIDESVKASYQGQRRINWFEIFAGVKAQEQYGEDRLLPDDTLSAIRKYGAAIKGPLTTPVAGGFRSLNVTLRQTLDLYACVRPVHYIPGVPTPMKRPDQLDIIIFRENTEDVYAGIEWQQDSDNAKQIIGDINKILADEGKTELKAPSAVGIKPVSEVNSKRLIRRAIRYAQEHTLPNVTLMHKGNIMKYTEGAFRDWGYELAREEFDDVTISEKELYEKHDGTLPAGKIVIKDRIADAMFQQLLLRPSEYSVVATQNLNGDYLSDAAAAQIGGIGVAPGYNIGDSAVLFEATHGTAPKYANLDVANPTALLLSGVEMLRFLDWQEAADAVVQGITKTIADGLVTYDFHRLMENATKVKTSEYAKAIVERM
jgi:isocitrate dehydrogenase